MRKLIYILLFFQGVISCKSISVANEAQIKTTQSIELGIIGENKIFILEQDYNSTALPKYIEPIKLNLKLQDFNKSSYKAFTSANNQRKSLLKISYVDSLNDKPKFLKLEIADRVTVLEALNNKENEAVKNYTLNKKNAHIISAISIVLSDEEMKYIINADALFLEQDGNKNYNLKAYKDKLLITSLSFSEGVVFAYQASNFCWQENDRQQLEIVDLVERTDKCPNTTYRSSKRAKKKVNYFKF